MIQFQLSDFKEKSVVSYKIGDVIKLSECIDGSFQYLVEEESVASFTATEYKLLVKSCIALFGSYMLQGDMLFTLFSDVIETVFMEQNKDIKKDNAFVTSEEFKLYFIKIIEDVMENEKEELL